MSSTARTKRSPRRSPSSASPAAWKSVTISSRNWSRPAQIAAYEVLGRDVVLYWRSLDAEQRVDLPISLIAAIPGTYTGPASRAYLYYTDEHKHWVDGMQVTITAKSS